jgi:DNA modification methylase
MEGAVDPALDTIHHGDCIAGMQTLSAGSIDLAFADPPFNIGYDYDVYDDQKGYHAYLDWTRQWMREVCRVLKPDGTFWLAIGDEYAAEMKLMAQNDLGLTCRSWVIWYYTFGVHCTKKFTRSHAHLFYFVKDAKSFTFVEDEVAVPSARQLVYADGRAFPGGRMPDDTWILRPQDVPDGFPAQEGTWYFPRVAGTFKERAGFHGCQMPEQLLGRIIRASSLPHEIVLDPFAGSGTTLAVAKKLGRRWIGFDLSEDYAGKARKRIERVQERQPLDGAAEPVMSAPRTPGMASDLWIRAGVERALIEAYLLAADGAAFEQVMSDRERSARFVDKCRQYGLPGKPADWTSALGQLHDAGRLDFANGKKRAKRADSDEEDEGLYRG